MPKADAARGSTCLARHRIPARGHAAAQCHALTRRAAHQVRYGAECPETNQMLTDARFVLNALKVGSVGSCSRTVARQ